MSHHIRMSVLAAAGLLSLTAIFMVAARAQEGDTGMETKIKAGDLAWLAGTWKSEDGAFEEHWLPPKGGSLAAVSRMVRDGRTVLFELSSIETAADGTLSLRIRHFNPELAGWASEAEGPMTWPLARGGADQAVFEEPTRAFPRRIAYRLESENTMQVSLEGERNGEPHVVTFSFKR